MKNKRVIYKDDNLTIFLKGKKNYLSVELDEEDFDFQTQFFENYYIPNNNFLLNYVGTDDNKLLFVFPDDFNFIDYTFRTKYDFVTDISKIKRFININTELEYDLNNSIIKKILELKPDLPFKVNNFKEIIDSYNLLPSKNKKFYNNVVSDLIFNKLLIHKRIDKFFFLDYGVFSISSSLQIEDSKKINYCEL